MFARLATDSGEPVPPRLPSLPPGGLTDGVVRVRAVEPDDADAIFDELTDPLTVHWGFGGPPLTAAAARLRAVRAGLEWLVGSTAAMAICVDNPAGPAVAGGIAVRQVGPPGVGGVGYGLRAAYRGRGLTAHALRLVRDWALTTGGLHRLELGANRDNVASQKVALAGGFHADGVRAERLRNADGSYSDEVRFACLASELG
jgi:RimJ/RimL family protein N-acetyltransferase